MHRRPQGQSHAGLEPRVAVSANAEPTIQHWRCAWFDKLTMREICGLQDNHRRRRPWLPATTTSLMVSLSNHDIWNADRWLSNATPQFPLHSVCSKAPAWFRISAYAHLICRGGYG
ncbi:hypothetical protein C7476_1018 [Phyllobacterium bourgognense]|uniref:Uncharacterized protein n=1 Tax=Phyllobacterium bourgognense TaxID=314236 RepID=A0A368Z5K0_9HYPH|nr:hypothetical protein C7476_1018 [Phyllobacterium bourgognense]